MRLLLESLCKEFLISFFLKTHLLKINQISESHSKIVSINNIVYTTIKQNSFAFAE